MLSESEEWKNESEIITHQFWVMDFSLFVFSLFTFWLTSLLPSSPQCTVSSFRACRWFLMWLTFWNVREIFLCRCMSRLTVPFVPGRQRFLCIFRHSAAATCYCLVDYKGRVATFVNVNVHFCTGLLSGNVPKSHVVLSNLISAPFWAKAYPSDNISVSEINKIFFILHPYCFNWWQNYVFFTYVCAMPLPYFALILLFLSLFQQLLLIGSRNLAVKVIAVRTDIDTTILIVMVS